MSTCLALEQEFAMAGVCPQCGRSLLVPSECGYCDWRDEKLIRKALANPPQTVHLPLQWHSTDLTFLYALSTMLPLVGIVASLYHINDDGKRRQAKGLLIYSLITTFLINLLFYTVF